MHPGDDFFADSGADADVTRGQPDGPDADRDERPVIGPKRVSRANGTGARRPPTSAPGRNGTVNNLRDVLSKARATQPPRPR
ncbi:MAG: hypothetical protein QOD69_3502, partial [Solirubrobacteraceae bacterium]|nr:hypothetical protein [Solirubrobacteraceae bacterium]